jgi:hypothetical protein
MSIYHTIKVGWGLNCDVNCNVNCNVILILRPADLETWSLGRTSSYKLLDGKTNDKLDPSLLPVRALPTTTTYNRYFLCSRYATLAV